MKLPQSLLTLSSFALLTLRVTSQQQFLSTAQDDQSSPIDIPTLLSFHKSLVNIPSVTGSEYNVSKFLASHLHSLNFTVEHQPVNSSNASDAQPRYNLLAYPSQCSRDTPILLTSHMDTVPPFYPYRRTAGEFDAIPLDTALLSDLATTDPALLHPITLHGRGSVDDYASLVAQVTALSRLLHSQQIPPCSAALLFVVGEEVDGAGMRAANVLNPGWRAVLFGEPTENRLASGHKGITFLTINTEGQSGHSGYPWLAVSANALMVKALGAVQALAEGMLEEKLPRSKKFGNTTVNIGRIEGGVAGNVIAERAEALVTMRLAGGTLREVKRVVGDVVDEATKGMLDEAEREGKHAKVMAEWSTNGYAPVNLDTDVNVWDEEDEEIETKRLSKGPITVNYGTDVPNLDGDHKRYLYGPGSILVAHSDHEAITVGDLVKGVEGYERLLQGVVKNLDID